MNTIQRTLVIIKTDTIKRKIVGKVIEFFEDAGFIIVAMKMLKPSISLSKRHYNKTKQWKIKIGTRAIEKFNNETDAEKALGTTDAFKVGNMVWEWSVRQLASGPIIVMVLQGDHAVKRVKKLSGQTEPYDNDPGTLRGKFANDSIINSQLEKRAIYNVIHESSDEKDAKREINVWFTPKEIHKSV